MILPFSCLSSFFAFFLNLRPFLKISPSASKDMNGMKKRIPRSKKIGGGESEGWSRNHRNSFPWVHLKKNQTVLQLIKEALTGSSFNYIAASKLWNCNKQLPKSDGVTLHRGTFALQTQRPWVRITALACWCCWVKQQCTGYAADSVKLNSWSNPPSTS